MKKFFAFVMVLVVATIANAGVWFSIEGSFITISTDTPVQALSIGVMSVDAGAVYLVSQNEAFIAGDSGFSGQYVNEQLDIDYYNPGDLVAFSRTCGQIKALGELAVFDIGGARYLDILNDDYLGIDSAVIYADGSVEKLEIMLPEPMSMFLLGVGGLIAARRR